MLRPTNTNKQLIVSIPFKREGTWKVCGYGSRAQSQEGRFQFPSNGKVHGKLNHRFILYYCVSWFQFPSNGKVHGKKKEQNIHQEHTGTGFNSLQTGRYMERKALTVSVETAPSFNSLQTGRYMERGPIFDPDGPWL